MTRTGRLTLSPNGKVPIAALEAYDYPEPHKRVGKNMRDPPPFDPPLVHVVAEIRVDFTVVPAPD